MPLIAIIFASLVATFVTGSGDPLELPSAQHYHHQAHVQHHRREMPEWGPTFTKVPPVTCDPPTDAFGEDNNTKGIIGAAVSAAEDNGWLSDNDKAVAEFIRELIGALIIGAAVGVLLSIFKYARVAWKGNE